MKVEPVVFISNGILRYSKMRRPRLPDGVRSVLPPSEQFGLLVTIRTKGNNIVRVATVIVFGSKLKFW